jgi:hypothetical protein
MANPLKQLPEREHLQYYTIINVDFRTSLRAPQLILQPLKLTTKPSCFMIKGEGDVLFARRRK